MKSYVFDVLKKAIDIYLRFKIRITVDIIFCSSVCFFCKMFQNLFWIIIISWAHFNSKLTISTAFLILKRKSLLKATYTFIIDNTNTNHQKKFYQFEHNKLYFYIPQAVCSLVFLLNQAFSRS